MRRSRPLRDLVGAALLALTCALPAAPAGANGTPIKIVLSYLVGVSSWGPTNATGVAELVTDEGEVRLTATGLAPLSGENYRVWIVNTASGERMTLGAFKAEGGVAKVDWVLKEAIPDKGWDLMLVSVEAEGSEPSEPSARRSIAGRFPVPAEAQGRPGQLPATGGAETVGAAASWPRLTATLGIVTLLGLALSAAIGFGLGRLSARRPR